MKRDGTNCLKNEFILSLLKQVQLQVHHVPSLLLPLSNCHVIYHSLPGV